MRLRCDRLVRRPQAARGAGPRAGGRRHRGRRRRRGRGRRGPRGAASPRAVRGVPALPARARDAVRALPRERARSRRLRRAGVPAEARYLVAQPLPSGRGQRRRSWSHGPQLRSGPRAAAPGRRAAGRGRRRDGPAPSGRGRGARRGGDLGARAARGAPGAGGGVGRRAPRQRAGRRGDRVHPRAGGDRRRSRVGGAGRLAVPLRPSRARDAAGDRRRARVHARAFDQRQLLGGPRRHAGRARRWPRRRRRPRAAGSHRFGLDGVGRGLELTRRHEALKAVVLP